MPQLQTSTLDAFRGLDEASQRTALSRMSDEAKRTLLDQIEATPAQSTPQPAKPGFNDSRDTLEVANDQVQSYLEGTGLAHPVQTAKSLYEAAKDVFTGKGTAKAQQAVAGAVTAPIMAIPHALQGVSTALRGAAALALPNNVEAPTSGEFAQAAHSGGELLANAPAIASVEGLVGGARKAMGEGAAKLYQKGLQPSPRKFSPNEIDALIKTGLDNGLPISRSGVNKLDTLVNDLNTSIESDISSNASAPVSPAQVVKRLMDAKKKAGTQVNPASDLGAIDSAEAEFLAAHPDDISATRAQEIKKGTYAQLNSKQFGEVGSGSIEAQKALARGIKEELQTYFPEIQGKNAAEGALLELRPELEAAVNRLGNRRISVANVLNIMADPGITSRLAIMLHKAGVPAATIGNRISAIHRLALASSAVGHHEGER